MYCNISNFLFPHVSRASFNSFVRDHDVHFVGNSISRHAYFSYVHLANSQEAVVQNRPLLPRDYRSSEKKKCPVLEFDGSTCHTRLAGDRQVAAKWDFYGDPSSLRNTDNGATIYILFGTLIPVLHGELWRRRDLYMHINSFANDHPGRVVWIPIPPVCKDAFQNKEWKPLKVRYKNEINQGIREFNEDTIKHLNNRVQVVRPAWYDDNRACQCYDDWVHHHRLTFLTLDHIVDALHDRSTEEIIQSHKNNILFNLNYTSGNVPASTLRHRDMIRDRNKIMRMRMRGMRTRKNSCTGSIRSRLAPYVNNFTVVERQWPVDAATLRDLIDRHGFVVVRNIIPPTAAQTLRTVVDNVFDEGDNLVETGRGFFSHVERERDQQGWRAIHSPSAAMLLLQEYERAGIRSMVSSLFHGETPCISSTKWNLRRGNGMYVPGWHQDGYFMDRDSRYLNMWIALDECGKDSVLPGMVYKQGGQRSFTKPGDYIVIEDRDVNHLRSHVPSFQAGDGVFFDEYIIHSTEFRENLNELMRHAIETWFHPQCSANNPYSYCLLWEPQT
jgi:ectoine hydroxylase-related dioxygenase (phytanoyl-CoA dioxygenase family)